MRRHLPRRRRAPQRELRTNPPVSPPPRPQPPVQDAPRRADPPPAPGASQTPSPGIRGFRDVIADANDLGRATAQANRSARKTYANVPSPTPEFDRLEPSMEDRGNDSGSGYEFDDLAAEDAPRPPQQMPPVRGRAKNSSRPRRIAIGSARCAAAPVAASR